MSIVQKTQFRSGTEWRWCGVIGKRGSEMLSRRIYILYFIALSIFVAGCSTKISDSSHDNTLRIGSVQYPIHGSQTIEGMLAKFEDFVSRAHRQGVEILVFPEWVSLDVWPVGLETEDREVVKWVAEEVTPILLERQKEWSRENGMTIIGSSARVNAGDTYVSAFITFPSGDSLVQDKIYLTKWERDQGLTSGQELLRIPYRDFHFVVLICYDVEFPDLSVDLMTDRPELLIVPAMTESMEGYERVSRTARARAVEQTAYVVTSHTVGRVTEDWGHYGRSELMIPQITGLRANEQSGRMNQSELVVMEIDIEELRRVRSESSWQPALSIKN